MNVRRLNFMHVSNMRDIGGYSTKDGRVTKFNRIYRSSLIKNLTLEEYNYLKKNNLCLNIDLRTPDDIKLKVNYLKDKVLYENVYLPDNIPELETDVPKGYLNMILDKNLKKIFDLLLEHKDLVIINCSMGKDRTGIVIMLLLLLCGVNNKDIIADYSLSYTYLKDDVNMFHLKHPEYPNWVGSSKSWYMEEAIKLFFNRFSSLKDYFVGYLGMDMDSLYELRESLLEDKE